jgi:Na+-transporting methylmalonyl-CoA/oxaloacetate decarboxylase gamma subunit
LAIVLSVLPLLAIVLSVLSGIIPEVYSNFTI